MSFIELFGGEWDTKPELRAEDAAKMQELIPKLQLSPEFLAKMGEVAASGSPVKTKITGKQ